jgi:hypothetical protein
MKPTYGHYLGLFLGALAAGVQSIAPQLTGAGPLLAHILVGFIVSVVLPALALTTPSALQGAAPGPQAGGGSK